MPSLTPGDIAERLLGRGGPIATALGASYETRAEQVRMARAVAEALASRSHLLVEAGTGVGKSFAYLVPAIHRAVSAGEVVVVATNTISLQEQLLRKDIPALASTLGGPEEPGDGLGWSGALRPVLVKGRGNYLSIRRLKLASGRQERLLPDAAMRRSLHVIEDWAYDTEDGTLSTLPELERPGVWDRVQSDSGNCMGRRCPTYRQCFYQNARREMEGANLLVCNHAMFFADLALRASGAGVLPDYGHVILDEAHAVEDVASEHFGLSLTEGRVMHLLTSLYQRRTRKGYLAQLELRTGDLGAVERAVDLTLAAETAARGFFDDLAEASERSRAGDVRGGRVLRPDVIDNGLTPAMNDLGLALRRLRERFAEEDEQGERRPDPDRYELQAYIGRAKEIADTAEALIAQSLGEDGAYCYWIELSDGGGSRAGAMRRVGIAASPIDVGPLLRARLFGGSCSVVLTSATLATRTVAAGEATERAETAFAHTLARLGAEGASTLQLGSPFTYAEQAEVFIDGTMPEPSFAPPARGALRGRAEGGYLRELVSRILDHLIATEGGAFVLFTSFALLYQVADELAGPLGELGFPLHAQGRGGSRTAILERFREDPRSVLLGAASFWQGVDVPGDGLRNVIITRLPFDPPDRPLTEARTERIRERGGNPFAEESLPRAIIRFKQGFGRLVRTSRDRGRVVVLDPRIVTRPYGRQFLKALPEGVPIRHAEV